MEQEIDNCFNRLEVLKSDLDRFYAHLSHLTIQRPQVAPLNTQDREASTNALSPTVRRIWTIAREIDEIRETLAHFTEELQA